MCPAHINNAGRGHIIPKCPAYITERTLRKICPIVCQMGPLSIKVPRIYAGQGPEENLSNGMLPDGVIEYPDRALRKSCPIVCQMGPLGIKCPASCMPDGALNVLNQFFSGGQLLSRTLEFLHSLGGSQLLEKFRERS